MSAFSDRPLYMGTVTGLRAFRVDKLGRLVGPQQGTVFTPGENTAKCRDNTAALTVQIQADLSRFTRGMGSASRAITTLSGRRPPQAPAQIGFDGDAADVDVDVDETQLVHTTAGQDCSCGFYAYYDGSNDYHIPITRGSVEAIVEGYGTVTVGDRGFRAEKARLVALVLPGRPRGWEVSKGRFVARTNIAYALFSAIVLVLNLIGQNWVGASVSGAGVLIFAALIYLQVKTVSYASLRDELVRRNYPDVPVYRTRQAALKAHPLTVPDPVTPETADDFWTRQVSS